MHFAFVNMCSTVVRFSEIFFAIRTFIGYFLMHCHYVLSQSRFRKYFFSAMLTFFMVGCLWVFKCWFNLSLVLNFLAHWKQSNFFSSEWDFWCLEKFVLDTVFPQTRQRSSIFDKSEKWRKLHLTWCYELYLTETSYVIEL